MSGELDLRALAAESARWLTGGVDRSRGEAPAGESAADEPPPEFEPEATRR